LVNPAFVGRRQQHLNFEATTAVSFTPRKEKEFAGMAYIQNEKNYLTVGKTQMGGKQIVVLYRVENGVSQLVAQKELVQSEANRELTLTILAKEGTAAFYFSATPGKRVLLAENVDITHLSTKKAKGFIGSYVGMYATTMGY
jgi:alpha-N-arabinofuranosidase